jgi:hypothetical protein
MACRIRDWYRVDKRLPTTATPSAPPSWMKVPLVAEPTPVLPRGTEFMTEADTDGITSAAPTPTMTMAGSIVRTET